MDSQYHYNPAIFFSFQRSDAAITRLPKPIFQDGLFNGFKHRQTESVKNWKTGMGRRPCRGNYNIIQIIRSCSPPTDLLQYYQVAIKKAWIKLFAITPIL